MAQRWYGGTVASRQVGIKAGGQKAFGMSDRTGVQIDLRRTDALFNPGYDGWQLGLYATHEHALSRALVGSAGVFVRRDWLSEPAYSNRELGITLGFGGELPHGITFSLSGSASQAHYDAPILFFSPKPRQDWRLFGRAALGDRSIRVLGFSPELSLSYARTASNVAFFSTDRLRFRVALARYF